MDFQSLLNEKTRRKKYSMFYSFQFKSIALCFGFVFIFCHHSAKVKILNHLGNFAGKLIAPPMLKPHIAKQSRRIKRQESLLQVVFHTHNAMNIQNGKLPGFSKFIKHTILKTKRQGKILIIISCNLYVFYFERNHERNH